MPRNFTRGLCLVLASVLSVLTVPASAQQKCPAHLLQPQGAAGDQFGRSIAVSGDTMIVGAPSDDWGSIADQGSAWIYRRSGSSWFLEAVLTASDGAANDNFGISVSVSADTAVVGAYNNAGHGSAYVFTRSGTVWTQQAKLTASDGAAGDAFGVSVAISGDTAVIGALGDDVGANTDQGSAYVFTRSGTVWTQQAKLTASGGAAGDDFGISVSVSADTAVVGAYQDDVGANTNQGSAYVFTRSGTVWTQQAKLTASDGAAADEFGISVSVSADTAVVGAYFDDVGANVDQGSAYVFTRSGTVWTQQAKLTASDGAVGDDFGVSVSVSGDTAVVGAFNDDVGANSNQGSAYVFTRSGTVWTQQAKLTASDGAVGDDFGVSVSVSGDTAVVGALFDDVGANSNQGSAYVFTRSGTVWTQQAQVTDSDASAGDAFGASVAISGDTAIVGVPGDDVGPNADQGSAYVFARIGSNWVQQAKLQAADGLAGDNFGHSVAIDADTAVVGAWVDDVGANTDQGSVYVFVRSGTTWTQQAKLVGSDSGAFELFGSAVAVSADTAVVGAYYASVGPTQTGKAYVFIRSGTVWTQQAILTASDGANLDIFGVSVGVSGNTAIVGADGADISGNTDQGAAYVFIRSGTVWSQQAKLTASDGAAVNYFGASVAIDGDTALAGAFGGQGRAYVFTRSGTVWSQQAKLTASDGAGGDNFGTSAALSGDTAVIGSYLDDVGANTDQGSAYIFTRSGTVWTQKAKLTASDGAANDWFGASVAVSGDTAVVGAYQDTVGANANQGSAWVFRHVGATWTGPDFNNSGTVTVQDLFDFLAAFFAGSPNADFNGLSGVTVQDLFDFLAAFFAGCP